MFESRKQSPSEKETEQIDRVLKNEAEGFFFNSYEQLSPEQKKQKILERWKNEQTKASGSGKESSWFSLDGNLDWAARALVGIGGTAFNTLMHHATAESTRKSSEIIEQARERQQTSNDLRLRGRRFLLSKSLDSFDGNSSVLDTTENTATKDQPEATESVPEEDIPPLVDYLKSDTLTLPKLESDVDVKERCHSIAEQLVALANKDAASFSNEDSVLAGDNQEFYATAVSMINNGDVDAALRFLDSNLGSGSLNVWTDDIRNSAASMGALKREIGGLSPIDFDDVEYAVSKNAARLAESGVPEDTESGALLISMLDRINEPGEYGVKAAEEILDYSERILAFRTAMLNTKLNQIALGETQAEIAAASAFDAQFWRNEVEEAQRLRDAIFQELQKKRKENDASEIGANTESVSHIPEDTEMRRTQLAEARERLNILYAGKEPNERTDKHEISPDWRSIITFEKEIIDPHRLESETEFKEWFNAGGKEECVRLIKARVKYLSNDRKNMPDTFVPDTVASVMTNGNSALIQQIMRARGFPMLNPSDTLNLPFSKFAKECLDVDVREIEPEYAQYFSPRPGSSPEIYGK